MPSLAPRAVGVIEMEPQPSRVETYFPEEVALDCAGELARLARAGWRQEDPSDPYADDIIVADTTRLAKELEAEYAAIRAVIAAAR